MSDEILSQEDLNALLAGAGEEGTASADSGAVPKADDQAPSTLTSQEELDAMLAGAADTASTGGNTQPAASEQSSGALTSQAELDALLAAGGAGDTTLTGGSQEQVAGSSSLTDTSVRMVSGPVVRQVEFGQLGGPAGNIQKSGVDLIMDVNVQVSVELGRSIMQVREVLGLGPGSVVELDKHAGEPVEISVNNKLVARGEVVVIDENFGVRITEMIDRKGKESHAQAA